jgi:hypothetical protein
MVSMTFRLQWDRWARLDYDHEPMSAPLPSRSRDAETASVPSSSTTPAQAGGSSDAPPPADLDRAINELIAYLAEAAAISPAEAFSAVAQGRVLEVPAHSDQPRPKLTGLNALIRHFVRRP